MFPKIIEKQYKHDFQILKNSLYIIEITARCKNLWQNKLRLFDDDDLRVEIDSTKFPKLYPKKKGLFDGPSNWNGNKLKNFSQTNVFVVYLGKGVHTLQFYGNQSPVLEKIDVRKFTKNLIKKELQPEDGERRPWLNVILVNLPLANISISASAKDGKAHEKNKRDDDNLKIVVDGQIQKNTSKKSHKNWYWCGKILKGRPKFFLKKLNFESAVHYIEIWTDRTPTLQNLELDLGKIEIKRELRQYKKVFKNEDYDRYDQEIIDAVDEWNKEFLVEDYPPEEPLDPNLVKAMVYVETRMGYNSDGFSDVIQVANSLDPAIHTLNNDGWKDPNTGIVAREKEWKAGKIWVLNYQGKANGDTPKESIFWGIRWLYHKAQGITNDEKRFWRTWKEAVRGYGPGDDEYVKKVWSLYTKGENPYGNEKLFDEDRKLGKSHLFQISAIMCLMLLALANISIVKNKLPNVKASSSADVAEKITTLNDPRYEEIDNQIEIALRKYTEQEIDKTIDDFYSIGKICLKYDCDPREAFYKHLEKIVDITRNIRDFIWITEMLSISASNGGNMEDLDNDGEQEAIILTHDFLNQEFVVLSIIDNVKGKNYLKEYKIQGSGYFYSSNSIWGLEPLKLLDITGDGIPEIIIFAGASRGGACIYVFQYNSGQISELLREDNLTRAEYIFSDLNQNGILEIRIKGEEVWNSGTKVEKIYEYDILKKDFVELVGS